MCACCQRGTLFEKYSLGLKHEGVRLKSAGTTLYIRCVARERGTMFRRARTLLPLAVSTARAFSVDAAHTGPKRVLVTGAAGQIGTELVGYLEKYFGAGNVIASDVKLPPGNPTAKFAYCDVLNFDMLSRVVLEQRISVIVHLASILSAIGEMNPQLAMKVNARGSENVLEVALRKKLQVLIPSTIAAFGPTTPKDMTPDLTIMRPTTMYGVTKVYVELLGYVLKFLPRRAGCVAAGRAAPCRFTAMRISGWLVGFAAERGTSADACAERWHKLPLAEEIVTSCVVGAVCHLQRVLPPSLRP